MIAARYWVGMIGVACLIIVACKDDPTANLAELDLLAHGIPIVIMAPENPEIKTMDLVFMKDVTIVKGDDFNVQIFESEATTRDIAVIKARLLREVKDNPYFHAIVQEDPAGFIYESHVDSSYVNFGFRFARIQGDKEYVFQQGLRGKFTLEAVKIMYVAVQ